MIVPKTEIESRTLVLRMNYLENKDPGLTDWTIHTVILKTYTTTLV